MALFKKKDEVSLTKNLKGKDLYDLFVDTMNENQYTFEPHDDNLFVSTVFKGDDMDINMFIKAEEDNGLVYFDCPLEFTVDESMQSIVLDGINRINNSINLGAFTLIDDRVWFRYHLAPFGKLNTADLKLLISLVASTVDDHDGDLNSLTNVRTKPPSMMYG